MNKSKQYKIETPDGREVSLKYTPRYFNSKFLDYRVDHFEFRGYAISETGYYSHFVPVDPDFQETDEDTIGYAKQFIEEKMNMKYGEPAQQSLLIGGEK